MAKTAAAAKTKSPPSAAVAAPSPARYVAVRAFWHNGALYKIGDVLDVDAATAQPYIAAGVLAETD